MSDREYRSAAKGESWKFQTMNAIDWCMRRAASKENFVTKMERAGTDVPGHGDDPEAAGAGGTGTGTGWEEERKAFLISLAQHPAGPVRAGVAFPAAGLGAAAGAAVDLGAALERTQCPVFVTRPHSESKALRREQEKKIAAGHKEDDHEDYTMELTM